MPIKVTKLDKDKPFTPHGEDWKPAGETGQTIQTIKASTLVYDVDDTTSVRPLIAKDVDGHVVWAKPFALTTTKVYAYDPSLRFDCTYDYYELGCGKIDISTPGVFTRLSALEPTKVAETALPARWEAGLDSRRREGTLAEQNAKNITEHLDYVFQGDRLQFMPIYSTGWETDYVKINNVTQPNTTGPYIINVDDADVNVEVKAKRTTFDVNFTTSITSTQGTIVTLSKNTTKIAYNGGLIFDAESHAFYPIKPHNDLLEDQDNILRAITWHDLIETSVTGDYKIELQFNNYYDWCDYEYTINHTDNCHLMTNYGQLAKSDSKYEPYKNLKVYLISGNVNIDVAVVETPLVTTLDFSFIASDNPVDFYGNTPADWAHLWHGTRSEVSAGTATRVYSNKIENVRIGSKIKFIDSSYSNMWDVQLDLYDFNDAVIDSYTIRCSDEDNVYTNYFYDIEVNGKDILTLADHTWTVEANDINHITVDIDHRYQMSGVSYEIDSTKYYGVWNEHLDEIPALTSWTISGGLVTLNLPEDYVNRYGGTSPYYCRFSAHDEDNEYSYEVEKVECDITSPVLNGDPVTFTGYATRKWIMYPLYLGFQDDTEAEGQWLNVWDSPISSINLPYGTIVHIDFPTTRWARLYFEFPLGYNSVEDEEFVSCYAPEATEEFYYIVSNISFPDKGVITGVSYANATIRKHKQAYKLKLAIDGSNPYGAWYKSAAGGTAITETDAIELDSPITITEASDHSKYILTIGTYTYYFIPTANSAQYKYTLSGASSSDTTLKKNTAIVAGAKREVQKYKITFTDKDVRYYYNNITPTSTTYEYDYGTTVTFDIWPRAYNGYLSLPQEVSANGTKLTPISSSTVTVDATIDRIYNFKASVVISGPTTISVVNKIDTWQFSFGDGDTDTEGSLLVFNSAGTQIGNTDLNLIAEQKDIYLSKGNTASLDAVFKSRLVYISASYEGHTCYGSENDDRIIYTSDIAAWGSTGVTITTYSYDDSWVRARIAEENTDGWCEVVRLSATVAHTDQSSAYETLYAPAEDTRAAVLKWNDGLAHKIYLTCGNTERTISTSGAIRFRSYDMSDTLQVTTESGWTIEPTILTFGDSSNSPYENVFTFTRQSFTVSAQNLPTGTTITGTGTYAFGSSVTVTIKAPSNQYFRSAPTITGGIGSVTPSESLVVDDVTKYTVYTYTFNMPANNVVINGYNCVYAYATFKIKCSTYFTGSITFLSNNTVKSVAGTATSSYNFSKAEGIKYNITEKSRLVYKTGTYGGHSCFGCNADDRVITNVGDNSTGSTSEWLRARWLGSETVYEEVYYDSGSTIFYDARTIGTTTYRDSTAAPIYNNSGQTLQLSAVGLTGYAKSFANGFNDIVFASKNNRNVAFSIPDSTHYTLTITSNNSTLTSPVAFRDGSSSPGALITVTAPPKSYTITTTGENGVVMTGGGTHTYGSTVDLSATAPSGQWVLSSGLDGWTGDSTQAVTVEKDTHYKKATRRITVTGDATYTVGCQAYYTFSYTSNDQLYPYEYNFVYSNGKIDAVAWNLYKTDAIAAGTINYFKLKYSSFFRAYSRSHSSTGWLSDGLSSYLGNGTDDRLITEWSESGLVSVANYSTKVFPFNFYTADPYIYVGFSIYDTSHEIANDASITITKGTDSRSGYIQVDRTGLTATERLMRLRGTCNGITRDFGRDRFAVGPFSSSNTLTVSGNKSSNYSNYVNIGTVSILDQFKPDSTATKYKAYRVDDTSSGNWGPTSYGWHGGWNSFSLSHWSNISVGWIMKTDRTLLSFVQNNNADLNARVEHYDCLKTTKIVWWGYSGSTSRWWWQSSSGDTAANYRHNVNMGVAAYMVDNNNNERGNAIAYVTPNGGSADGSVRIIPWGWSSDTSFLNSNIATKVKVAGSYYIKWGNSSTYQPTLYWRGIHCYRYKQLSGHAWALTTFTTALPIRK